MADDDMKHGAIEDGMFVGSTAGVRYHCKCGWVSTRLGSIALCEMAWNKHRSDESADADTPTRDELIALCEAAIVPVSSWHDRDSAKSQIGIGKAWALLRAGAPFTVLRHGKVVIDDKTIWIEITWPGFNAFEWRCRTCRSPGSRRLLVPIPTAERLASASGRDWY